MKKGLLAATLSALLLSSSSLVADDFVVDPSHTTVSFKVKHMMVSTVTGRFNLFNGEFEIDNGVLKALEGHIEAASVDTGIADRDDHLRSADFFDAANHPDIKFVMKSATKDKVTGDITIRGITKPITLDVEMGGVITDNSGSKRAGLELNGKLNRKDFDLKWNRAIEAGGFTVGDEVRIHVEIEGVEM
ncbi:MAG: YceI family protein [Sulfuricurvum sp.]|jgi:polyisoprenoid-binding protein YceI